MAPHRNFYDPHTISLPLKIKFTASQIQALITVLCNGSCYTKNILELNAVLEVSRKLFLKLQRRVVMPKKQTTITFCDTELWALSYIIGSIPEGSYEKQCLYSLIDTILRRII